jgi:hypothetical protein
MGQWSSTEQTNDLANYGCAESRKVAPSGIKPAPVRQLWVHGQHDLGLSMSRADLKHTALEDATIEKRGSQRNFAGAKRVDEKVWRHHTTRSSIPEKPGRAPQHVRLTGTRTSFSEVDVMRDRQGKERDARGFIRYDRYNLFPVLSTWGVSKRRT